MLRITGTTGSDAFDFTPSPEAVTVQADNGDDRVTGSRFGDVIGGNNGNDTILGGAGDDRLMGGAGNDFDPAVDVLHGPDGIDHLDGGAGNDTLGGGASADTLLGGLGNDVLQGGSGADTLTGGDGADTFVYAALADGGDRITDFEQGADRIDLSALGGLAKPSATVRDGQTIVSVDVTGDRVADMSLTLDGVHALTAADFIL